MLLRITTIAQDYNFWHTLAEVGYERQKDKSGYDVDKPMFSKNLKSWHKKKIRLKGYVVPVNELTDQNKFMLSSLPFNVCYFCGAAGPETVIEVEADKPVAFSSKPIWMEGTLLLNSEDADHHMYRLTGARKLSPDEVKP